MRCPFSFFLLCLQNEDEDFNYVIAFFLGTAACLYQVRGSHPSSARVTYSIHLHQRGGEGREAAFNPFRGNKAAVKLFGAVCQPCALRNTCFRGAVLL